MIETPTARRAAARRRQRRACRQGDVEARCAAGADGVPEPVRQPQPAQEGRRALEEPLAINTGSTRPQRAEKARAMMAQVGLRPEHDSRYPHMFSGGQRQRIAIARALMLRPERRRRRRAGVGARRVDPGAGAEPADGPAAGDAASPTCSSRTTSRWSSYIADDVLVMYLGKAVEQGAEGAHLRRPLHPYTRALLASTPRIDPRAAPAEHGAAGRAAVAARAAVRLRRSTPAARMRSAALRGGGAAARGCRRRPVGRLRAQGRDRLGGSSERGGAGGPSSSARAHRRGCSGRRRAARSRSPRTGTSPASSSA